MHVKTLKSIETPVIQCFGDQSCAQTNITALAQIRAYGAYSLYNSTIISNGDITIDLQGYYAGYRTKLYCQQGDECIINCFGNGCTQFYVQCDGVCTINLNSNATVAPINDLSMFDDSETPFLYDSLTITTETNNECDSMPNFAFDDYREKYQQNISTTTDIICCRGDYSCRFAPSIVSGSEYPIVCSGYSSCSGDGGNISSNDDLICSGVRSCFYRDNEDSVVSAEGNIYCFGDNSCSSINDAKIKVNDGQSLYCSGYSSCLLSNIQSNGNIAVYFLGAYSGEQATVICEEGDECNIVCGGFWSCSGTILNCTGQCVIDCNADSGCPLVLSANPTTIPTAMPSEATLNPTTNPLQNLNCNTAFECFGQTLASYNDIYAYGYKSISNSTVSKFDQIFCNGAYGCYESQQLGATSLLFAFGGNSADSMKGINGKFIACYGSNSCHNSQIEANVFVQCRGDQSCAQSNINLTAPLLTPLNGNGAYSLYNSTIISNGNISVDLSGYYAGYGASLYCQQDDQCIINCFGNGCTQFYIVCDGVCTINLNSDDTIPPINDTAMIDDSETPFLYDSQITTTNSNDQCDSSNLAFDDNEENRGQDTNTTTDIVCCRSYLACAEGRIFNFGTHPTVCSGSQSCYQDEIIYSNQDIICSGLQSCRSTNVITSANGDIYCLGSESCQDVDDIQVNDEHLYCGGDRSCQSSNIRSNGHSAIYFLGDESGQNANVTCEEGDECLIVCGGHDSCNAETTLNCIGQCIIDCNEDTGCPLVFSANPSISPSSQPTEIPSNHPTAMPTSQTSNPTMNPSVEPTTLNPKISPSVNAESESESVSNDQSDSDSDDDMAKFVYIHLHILCKLFFCTLVCLLFRSRNLFFGRQADEIKDEEEERKKKYDFVLDLSHSSWIYVWTLFVCLMLINAFCFIVCCKYKKMNI